MHTFVSLLRGINVGGHKKIRMEELRDIYAAAGFTCVESYLQSGNVVFAADDPDRTRLTARLEAAIDAALGYAVSVILRDGADLKRIIANNPFLATREAAPTSFHVAFLAQSPSAADLTALTVPASDADEFQIVGQEIYLFYPNGAGRTKLTNNLFERKLHTVATTRNWNTVMALYGMTQPDRL